ALDRVGIADPSRASRAQYLRDDDLAEGRVNDLATLLVDDDLPTEALLDRPLTALGGALDAAALRGMCLAFDATLAIDAAERERVRGSLAPYVTPALERAPRGFFAFLDDPAPPRLLTSTRCRAIE